MKNVLTPDIIQAMKQAGDKFRNKNYDIYFEWNDDKIYCPELVWKTCQRATGIEVGEIGKVKRF